MIYFDTYDYKFEVSIFFDDDYASELWISTNEQKALENLEYLKVNYPSHSVESRDFRTN